MKVYRKGWTDGKRLCVPDVNSRAGQSVYVASIVRIPGLTVDYLNVYSSNDAKELQRRHIIFIYGHT